MVVKSRVGPIHLRVTRPGGDGRKGMETTADFCVAFITPLAGERLCREMGVSVEQGSKLEHRLDGLAKGLTEEIPVIARVNGMDRLEVQTDAHVLAAMVKGGVESIPVMVHFSDVERLRAFV